MFEGRPKTTCVIEGKWADGLPFRYEAWDSCGKMHVRAFTEKDYKNAPSLGDDDQYSVADIPRGSEVLEPNNGVSTALIFRDRESAMQIESRLVTKFGGPSERVLNDPRWYTNRQAELGAPYLYLIGGDGHHNLQMGGGTVMQDTFVEEIRKDLKRRMPAMRANL